MGPHGTARPKAAILMLKRRPEAAGTINLPPVPHSSLNQIKNRVGVKAKNGTNRNITRRKGASHDPRMAPAPKGRNEKPVIIVEN